MNDFQKKEVFEAFIEANRPLWMRLAMRVIENREEAEDLVQKTLVNLWEKRNELEMVNPGAYVARAIWLNAIKWKTRSKPHLSLESVPEVSASSGLAREEPLSSHLEHLEGALRRLPEEQQRVLHLRFQMDLTFKEIGEMLQISLNTAASRTRYALKTLKKILSSH